ncbi:MAG: manganese efflux pump MntP family protein [Proteobacteria bacterium]|nr:manganese efflux pump MntP family protein [Pseudomonadota bacterium]MBU1417412.1 manganese efflux pump MntP family protein [Pseudomonadota bacterium]MBU1456009.1 manganese efflux pump MntP family protein [Pseudomonadota bacterium]
MDIVTLTGIAIALAMDAFAVALGAGVILQPLTGRHLFRLGFHFGLFQGLMPIIGWMAGLGMQTFVTTWAPWIAFGLLSFVGAKMVHEALQDNNEEKVRKDPSRGGTLVLLSIATSIDALAVGFSLALISVTIWYPALIIALCAAILTVAGLLLGNTVGAIWGKRVEVLGGMILIGIGLKIVLQS